MARWEPDSRGRLQEAALALFVEQGYDQTTVAQIADRAGVTERTFFRHFADKREVLFAGGAGLQELMLDGLGSTPADAAPLDAVGAALHATTPMFAKLRPFSARRAGVVAAHAELRERELLKLTSLAEALAGALRDRGVAEPAASLAAQTGLAVFHVAFGRWIEETGPDGTGPHDFSHHLDEALATLVSVAGPRR